MNPIGFVLPAATIGLGSLLLRPQRGFFTPARLATREAPQVPILQPQITLEEIHHDEIVITDHPVERGARVSDHFYKQPAEVIIRCAWSNSPAVGMARDQLLVGSAIGAASAVGGTAVRIAAAASPSLAGIRTIQSILSGNAANQVASIYEALLALQVSGIPFDIYTGKRSYADMLFRSLHVTTAQATENTLMLTATCRQVLFAYTRVINTTVNNDALANSNDTAITEQGAVATKASPDVTVPTP